MLKTIQYQNLTWHDIENPGKKELTFLKNNFKIDPLVLEEVTCPSQRPWAEEFEHCFYAVVHVPLFDLKSRVTTPGELDIIITKNHLITSHLGTNLPLKSIFTKINKDPKMRQLAMSKSVGFLFYFVLNELISSCFPKINHINEQIDKIEKDIFADNNRSMIKETSMVKRDILSFRRTLKPQKNIIESLVQKKYNFLEESLNKYFYDLIGTNIRVWNALENTKEVIESLEETNNTLVSHRMTQTIRFLSAISLITFALSVTTGIFSVLPFANFAIAHEKNTFWFIILFMLLVVLFLWIIFRKKRWL